MARGTALFCVSSSVMLGCAKLGCLLARLGERGKSEDRGMIALFGACTFFLAVPLLLTFPGYRHSLSVHVCLDKGCLHLWWGCGKYGEG